MQYFDELIHMGFVIDHSPLINDQSLASKYNHGKYPLFEIISSYAHRFLWIFKMRRYDVVWIEKEVFPWLPFWIEKIFLSFSKKFVLDFDDAVFHTYDKNRWVIIRFLLGNKLDRLIAASNMTVCGNNYLAARARVAGCNNVFIIPTVVNCERYPLHLFNQQPKNELPRVVWIGSPSTVGYLHGLSNVLLSAFKVKPFVLRVIGADFQLQGLMVEVCPWSESDEVRLIAESDVGLMPLTDSYWERGKCGYKLIQYMAVGLPVLASPVGINCEIVTPGFNGYLPRTDQEWVKSLLTLLNDTHKAQVMGLNGRSRVESDYCLQITAPKLCQLLISLN